MPLPSVPARALAQTIAAKQRTSTIFNDAAPARRPSACGTDQQTQHFVRNLRAHTPRSPSITRSSSSLSSQTRERVQRNYMNSTSSSRRRSKNAGFGDDGFGAEHSQQTTAPSNYFSPSASRLRSQSPCRTAVAPVTSSALHATTRAGVVRQGPPLPRSRAPSVPRNLQLQQPPSSLASGGLRQHGKSLAGSSAYSWQLEKGSSSFVQRPRHQPRSLLQQQQTVEESLSSSWTVRDPLTSAGNAHADLVGADDESIQLDASDQRELSQLTASFGRTGLLGCYAATSQDQALADTASLPSAGAAAAPPPGSNESQPQFSGLPIGPIESLNTLKCHQHMQGAPSFPVQACDQHQQQQKMQAEHMQQEPQNQQHHQRQQQPQQQPQQQQAMLRPWPYPPQPQEPSSDGISTLVMGRLRGVSSAPQSDKKPGVALSAFGMISTPPGCRASYEGLWKLVGTLKFCLRFVVVLIVCLFRLLNTSYDSWSATQFRKAFEEILAGPASREGSADAENFQGVLGRSSVASIANSQQQRQQLQRPRQQQQLNLPSLSSRNPANARSTVGGLHQCESDTGRDTRKKGFDFASTCKKAESNDLGIHRRALKVLSLVMAVVSLLFWLFISTAPKEEFVDFDFM